MLYSETIAAYAPELNQFKPPEIFNFNMEMDKEFCIRFVESFYFMYGDRQIGTTNPKRFRQWIRSIYMNKLPRYKKLLESTVLIDNPFLTTEMEHWNVDKEKRKSKLYGDYKSHGWANAQENKNAAAFDNTITSGESTHTDASINDVVEKNKETHNDKSDQKENITKRNWFSDTPQSGVNVNANGEDDNKLFNGGYLTKYEKDNSERKTNTYSEGGSGAVKDRWDKTDSIGGESTAGQSANYNTQSTTGATSSDNTAKTNTTQTTGSILDNKSNRKRKGYEGYEKSILLQHYRETLINVIEEFLEEFDTCFMQVY